MTTTTSTSTHKIIANLWIGNCSALQVAEAVADFFSTWMPNTAGDITPISDVIVGDAVKISEGKFQVEVEFDFEDGATIDDLIPEGQTALHDGYNECTLQISRA
jgi:hypothetical protein